jgi:hypothetical protein
MYYKVKMNEFNHAFKTYAVFLKMIGTLTSGAMSDQTRIKNGFANAIFRGKLPKVERFWVQAFRKTRIEVTPEEIRQSISIVRHQRYRKRKMRQWNIPPNLSHDTRLYPLKREVYARLAAEKCPNKIEIGGMLIIGIAPHTTPGVGSVQLNTRKGITYFIIKDGKFQYHTMNVVSYE